MSRSFPVPKSANPTLLKPKLPAANYNAVPARGNTVPNVKISQDDHIYRSWKGQGRIQRMVGRSKRAAVLRVGSLLKIQWRQAFERELLRSMLRRALNYNAIAALLGQVHVRANISKSVAEPPALSLADTAPSILTSLSRSTAGSWSSATCPRFPSFPPAH